LKNSHEGTNIKFHGIPSGESRSGYVLRDGMTGIADQQFLMAMKSHSICTADDIL
jgi:hypothetical protein